MPNLTRVLKKDINAYSPTMKTKRGAVKIIRFNARAKTITIVGATRRIRTGDILLIEGISR